MRSRHEALKIQRRTSVKITDEGAASGLDDVAGDDCQVVDLHDAFDLDEESLREPEVSTGQIERELPDFLDILAVTVTAGLGFRAAMERVGETLDGPLAEEIGRTLRRMDVGVRRRQAFVELRERNPRSTTMGPFVTAIIQAEELGAPLADTLNQFAGDMRREFFQQARRRVARPPGSA